jgi:endonuclease III
LIARYGVLEDGVGKGSVDWNKVRLGTTDELRDVIRCGGLADVKSRNIKRILELVWEENEEMRREAGPADSCIKQEPESSSSANTTRPLSLDHLHHLPTAVAMQRLMSLPGIGVKTASCVSMFCMQRDSFPVDTHVWRLCKWLGWTPEAATRDQTFMHTGEKGTAGWLDCRWQFDGGESADPVGCFAQMQ